MRLLEDRTSTSTSNDKCLFKLPSWQKLPKVRLSWGPSLCCGGRSKPTFLVPHSFCQTFHTSSPITLTSQQQQRINFEDIQFNSFIAPVGVGSPLHRQATSAPGLSLVAYQKGPHNGKLRPACLLLPIYNKQPQTVPLQERHSKHVRRA